MGAPTGARNAGSGTPTGDQGTDTNRITERRGYGSRSQLQNNLGLPFSGTQSRSKTQHIPRHFAVAC